MENFDKEKLKALEKLSRIKLSKKEEEKLLVELKRVISYIEMLDELDTENVSCCDFVLKGLEKNVRLHCWRYLL